MYISKRTSSFLSLITISSDYIYIYNTHVVVIKYYLLKDNPRLFNKGEYYLNLFIEYNNADSFLFIEIRIFYLLYSNL